MIPLISGYFLYVNRKDIFLNPRYGFSIGMGLILVSTLLYLLGTIQGERLDQRDYLSLVTLSAVIFWMGGFGLCFGTEAFRKALFPLLFLIFVIPIPTVAAEQIIFFLQSASAEAANGLFRLIGVPVYREGFLFQLPGISIDVAEECSGIRSSIALVITSVIAGKLFLVARWRRCILTCSVVPIAIMKNGLRIVTLSLLGSYVDERILAGPVHQQGGIPFFVLSVSLLLGVLWPLRRSEKTRIVAPSTNTTTEASDERGGKGV